MRVEPTQVRPGGAVGMIGGLRRRGIRARAAADGAAVRAGPARAVRVVWRPAELLGRLQQRRLSRSVRRVQGRRRESAVSLRRPRVRGRRRRSRRRRHDRHARRRVGRLRRRRALEPLRRLHAALEPGEQALSLRRQALRRRRARSRASTSRARRGRCRGSTSTTTAGSTCSSRSATRRTCCSTTTGTSSSTSRKDMGVDDPRKTVGAVWFDMNEDGRLDLFIANQDGTLNGLFRNDGARFVDVAARARHGRRRPARELRQQRTERRRLRQRRPARSVRRRLRTATSCFTTKAAAGSRTSRRRWGSPAATRRRRRAGATTTTTAGPTSTSRRTSTRPVNEHDFLFHNDGAPFTDAMPEVVAKHGATHGVQWVDFDGDGALDLALANNNPDGGHYLFRNLLPPDRARRSIQVARGRRARSPHARRVGGARLRARDAQGARRPARRHRRRLLLAEHRAGPYRIAGRRQGRRRGDGDDESGPKNHARRGRRSQQAAEARARGESRALDVHQRDPARCRRRCGRGPALRRSARDRLKHARACSTNRRRVGGHPGGRMPLVRGFFHLETCHCYVLAEWSKPNRKPSATRINSRER